jgi:hypothetical protein
MTLFPIATALTGTFFGAALYINLAEHPARVSLGTEFALREFGPSYQRASLMQATLAALGFLAGLIGAWQESDGMTAVGAVLIGLVIPFTLIVIFPTNKRLLDPTLDPSSDLARTLLVRWNALHWVRTILSGLAFSTMLWRLAALA